MNYINVRKKKLTGRNNNLVEPLVMDYAAVERLQFQFINDKNQIQDIPQTSGFYLAGSLGIGLRSTELLFLSKGFNILSGNTLECDVDTYTTNYLNKIKKKYTEINIELGLSNENEKQVLMRDYALACPRVYVDGQAPIDPEEISGYYTKTEVNNLLTLKQNLITESSKLDFSLISGASSFIPASEKGAASGVATLDANAKVLSSQLPAMDYAPTSHLTDANAHSTLFEGKVSKLSGTGAPTTATVGTVGDLYTDTNTNYMYECTAAGGDTYTWRKVGAEYLPLSGGNVSGDINLIGYTLRAKSINHPPGGASYVEFVCSNRFFVGGSSVGVTCQNGNYDYTMYMKAENGIPITKWNGGTRYIIKSIPAATSAYTLTEGVSSHAPTTASTYTLPNITDSTVTHDIVLYADFTSTASVAFQDASGNTIEVKTSLIPAVGEKWVFYCTYEFGKWNVYGLRAEEVANA